MRQFEAYGKVVETKKSSDDRARYIGLKMEKGEPLWVFLPPEVNDESVQEGTVVLVRGFAKRHEQKEDWWGLVAAQLFVLNDEPPAGAAMLLVGEYAGSTTGHYRIRGKKGEHYLVRGPAPSGVAPGDTLAVRGVPLTEEPGKLVLAAEWATVVRKTRTLKEAKPAAPQPAPTRAPAEPKPAAPAAQKPAPPKPPAPKPEEKPKKRGGLFGGLFGKK